MKKIIILTILSAFLIAGLAVAQPGQGDRDFNRGNKPDGMQMILKMADKLELTEKQTEQIETMAVEFKLERITLQAEIEKEEVLMKSLMRNDDASEKEVFAKIDKISALKANAKKLRISHKNAVQAILTAEQTAKLKELRKNHRFANRRGGDFGQNEFGPRNNNLQGKPCDVAKGLRKN